MAFKSSFLTEADERGYINQCSDLNALDLKMSEESITAYAGFDPTAKSLQVGNLLQIMMARLLQKHGHRPILLMGGATSLIGDPTGKTALRKMLTKEDITAHISSIEHIFRRVINFDRHEQQPLLLNNADWLMELNYISFLRDFGALFSVNRMLGFDSVKSRLDRQDPLSLLEFNYMVFQAYDYLYLNQHYACTLQTGGSDQWGNIVSGLDLVRRVEGKQVFALTTELVVTSNGQKMGKTADGAVWLNASMTSPYDFWQFWRNTDDRDVIKYMKFFTDIPISEIKAYEKLSGQDINTAKIALADRVTSLIHSEGDLPQIHSQVEAFFQGNSDSDIPTFEVTKEVLSGSLDKILLNLELFNSLGEIKRLVAGKGLKINDVVVEDPKAAIDIPQDKRIKVSIGKKKHYVIKEI